PHRAAPHVRRVDADVRLHDPGLGFGMGAGSRGRARSRADLPHGAGRPDTAHGTPRLRRIRSPHPLQADPRTLVTHVGQDGILWRVGNPPGRVAYRGMVFSMATTKITITLEDSQVEEIRALVGAGQASSVSGFVQHAVKIALFDAAGWKEMLDDALRQTGGP